MCSQGYKWEVKIKNHKGARLPIKRSGSSSIKVTVKLNPDREMREIRGSQTLGTKRHLEAWSEVNKEGVWHETG